MNEIIDFFANLFDYSDWPARWHCGHWSHFHGWLYIVSDLMIWSAYFTIPLVIIGYISRKRQTAGFLRLYFLFAAFILACGATHFLDAMAFWVPLYRLNALVKLGTGILSWVTVYYIFKNLPRAFALRSVDELQVEIEQRKQAEEQVKVLNAKLQDKVAAQTQEIIETEGRFRSIIDNSSEAISLLNGSFGVIYSNAVAVQLTGRTEQQRREIMWTDMIHEEDKLQLQATLKDILENHGVIYNVSFRMKHMLGHDMWLEGSFKNMLNDSVVNAIVCNFRDVTERKKAEEQRSIYEFIINCSGDAIVSKNLDGIITSWNSGAESIFGYTASEAIGKHISILIPEERKNEDQEILDKIKHGDHIDHYETDRITKDGKRIYISQMVSPVKDAAGNIIGVSKISRDITEQKLVKDQLIKTERIYHTIAANLPGSIVTIIGMDRKYILAEGEGIDELGYSKATLEGNTEQDSLLPETYEQIRPFRDRAFAGESVWKDFKLHDKYYLIRFLPLFDDAGVQYAVLTISLDITNIKQAEEEIKALNETLEKKVIERTAQLEIANKEMEAFSYSVSHDLRAPLRIINGYADILRTEHEESLGDEGNRLLGVIMNSTRQMGILIDALLSLSRLGRKELVIRNIDMSLLVTDIVEQEMIHTAGRSEFVIGELPPAHCDQTLIKHVWSNLISNAIKYSSKRERPLITISATQDEYGVTYAVKDNGAGFDMAYSHKLFSVFQRLHKKTDFDGTGVGLALVHRIIQKHGGRVWAEAEEDKGATFYFSLPL